MSSAGKIKLKSFDDLFGEEETSAAKEIVGEVKGSDIKEIPIEKLVPFSGHTFQVNTTADSFYELVDSIKENGKVLNPVLVRPKENDVYEIISGHRRTEAAKKAGLTTVPCIIRDFSDDEATVVMVDSNIQRTDILPSEKAFSYKARMEAIKHMKENKSDWNITEKTDEALGENYRTVYRIISLTNLIPDLLDSVDAGVIKPSIGYDLATLSKEDQETLYEYLISTAVNISTKQSKALKEAKKPLTAEKVISIFEKPKAKKRDVSFKAKELDDYFDPSLSGEDVKDIMIQLLSRWKAGDITL